MILPVLFCFVVFFFATLDIIWPKFCPKTTPTLTTPKLSKPFYFNKIPYILAELCFSILCNAFFLKSAISSHSNSCNIHRLNLGKDIVFLSKLANFLSKLKCKKFLTRVLKFSQLAKCFVPPFPPIMGGKCLFNKNVSLISSLSKNNVSLSEIGFMITITKYKSFK